MASPVVAGVAAMMLAYNPTLNVEQVKDILYSTATDLGSKGRDNYYGHGLVNAQEALKAVPHTVYVKSIAVSGASSLELGKTTNMSVSVAPSNATNKKVSWSVQNGTGGARIDSSGKLTAEKAGSVTVVATAADGSGVTGRRTVTVTADRSAPTARAIQASQQSKYSAAFDIYAYGVSDISGVASVRFAVWSQPDQSDIKWYNGENFNNGNWGAGVNIANHNNNRGTYQIHAYAADKLGNDGFIGGTTVTVARDTSHPSAGAVTVAPASTYGTTFDTYAINVRDDSGVASVRFAVWSQPDQSDIKWYSGENFNNGNWGLRVDTATITTTGGLQHTCIRHRRQRAADFWAHKCGCLSDTAPPTAKAVTASPLEDLWKFF
jgi:hypothetical protein